MAEMKRVTPDEVIEAYRATGLQPAVLDWAHFDVDGKPCGCALTALYFQKATYTENLGEKVYDLVDEIRDDEAAPYLLFEEHLGLDQHYTEGFALGFDGGHLLDTSETQKKAGYADGAETRKRILRFDADEYGNEKMVSLI